MHCTNIMRGMMTLTSDAFLSRAQIWAKRLEDREAARRGAPVADVRDAVARKIGISPGTLENLRNGRLKSVAAHIFASIRECVVHELTSEVLALEHELQMARACGLDPRGDEVAAVDAAIATALELLRKA